MISELCITINLSTLRTKNQFIHLMNEQFSFPNYFGFNLDAVDECMCDLSWLNTKKINICFRNIERIKNNELKEFINNTLIDYQTYWENVSNQNLSVSIQLS